MLDADIAADEKAESETPEGRKNRSGVRRCSILARAMIVFVAASVPTIERRRRRRRPNVDPRTRELEA